MTTKLSLGAQSDLIRAIVEDFVPRFVPECKLVHVGDPDTNWGYFDRGPLARLGVQIESLGKMPDVVLHSVVKGWLLLVESSTSGGVIDGNRRAELARAFASSALGLVYVTVFPDRDTMARQLSAIAWETVAWVVDSPTHLVHFNGERLLGPYAST